MSVIKAYAQKPAKQASSDNPNKEMVRASTPMENGEKEMSERAMQRLQQNPYKDARIEVKVINNSASIYDSNISGYGYDIYLNGVLFIHQPYLPAVNGNKGFSSEEIAHKAGDVVSIKSREISRPHV